MRSELDFVRRCGLLLAALLVAVGLGLGCGKGGDNAADSGDSAGGAGPAGPDGVVAGHVSFTIDGEQYSGTTCIAYW